MDKHPCCALRKPSAPCAGVDSMLWVGRKAHPRRRNCPWPPPNPDTVRQWLAITTMLERLGPFFSLEPSRTRVEPRVVPRQGSSFSSICPHRLYGYPGVLRLDGTPRPRCAKESPAAASSGTRGAAPFRYSRAWFCRFSRDHGVRLWATRNRGRGSC